MHKSEWISVPALDVIDLVMDKHKENKDFIITCIREQIKEWKDEDLQDVLSGKMDVKKELDMYMDIKKWKEEMSRFEVEIDGWLEMAEKWKKETYIYDKEILQNISDAYYFFLNVCNEFREYGEFK